MISWILIRQDGPPTNYDYKLQVVWFYSSTSRVFFHPSYPLITHLEGHVHRGPMTPLKNDRLETPILYAGWDFLIYLIFDPGIFPSAPVIPYEARCLGTRLKFNPLQNHLCTKKMNKVWNISDFFQRKNKFLNTSGYQTWRGIWWKPLLPGTTWDVFF